jgi:hypothetical protein
MWSNSCCRAASWARSSAVLSMCSLIRFPVMTLRRTSSLEGSSSRCFDLDLRFDLCFRRFFCRRSLDSSSSDEELESSLLLVLLEEWRRLRFLCSVFFLLFLWLLLRRLLSLWSSSSASFESERRFFSDFCRSLFSTDSARNREASTGVSSSGFEALFIVLYSRTDTRIVDTSRATTNESTRAPS